MTTRGLLSESEGLTTSRLLRYAATHACTNATQWGNARQALSESPDDENKITAGRELDEQFKSCGCTPCTARRVMKE